MTHPNAITIGPLTYAVTSDETTYKLAVADEKTELYGCINYGDLRITLSPHQAPMHLRASLLHDVLHGALHTTDPELADEERAVRALCLPLLDVLRRNPELVAYLTAEE